MSAVSKQVFDQLSSPDFTCRTLVHPSTDSCVKALLDMILQTLTGSSKSFLIIYILQSIINWKKMNKRFINKQLYAYCRSLMYAVAYGTAFVATACFMRKGMHQYYYHSLAVCGFNGGLAIFIESEENRALNTSIYTNLVAETILRYIYWKNWLPRNALQETFLFMTCSATLMYLLKNQKTDNKIKNLWFYYPSRIKSNLQDGKSTRLCTHESSCYDYFYEGLTTYFAVGYVLQLLKYVLPRLDKIIFNPLQIMKAVFSKDKYLFGLFLGSYVGIYRIVSCLLRRRDKEEKPFHSLLAGFLAGFSYIFKPTLSMTAIAFTTALQLTIQRITYLNDLQSKFPAREIVFALCSGFLFHNRFFLPDSCPKYVKNMLNAMTNGKVNEIYELLRHYFGRE